jgi:hypothetical protein
VSVPKSPCQRTRAIRLAFDPAHGGLGAGEWSLKEVLERAQRWRPELTPAQLQETLDRLAAEGEIRAAAGMYAYKARPTQSMRRLARAQNALDRRRRGSARDAS